MPYSEEDAPFFFGRDAEREIIIANLMTSRLTLFYGPSGVGKSSVLRAGVAHNLRRLARENLDETGCPQFAVVVFNSWRYDPITALEARVRDSAMKSLDGDKVAPVPSSRSLSEMFKAWTERLGGELLRRVRARIRQLRRQTRSAVREPGASAATPEGAEDP